MNTDSNTHVSLLLQVQDANTAEQADAAWDRFVRMYGPMILKWCQRWRLQSADAEDVTQAMLLKLFQKLNAFEYDRRKGRFRGWLKSVTWNTVCDFCRAADRAQTAESAIHEQIANTAAQEDFVVRMERMYDLELLQMAKQSVRERVEPHTWDAFEMSETTNLSPTEIADRCGMKIATVYVARSKVRKMIQAEVAEIDVE